MSLTNRKWAVDRLKKENEKLQARIDKIKVAVNVLDNIPEHGDWDDEDDRDFVNAWQQIRDAAFEE